MRVTEAMMLELAAHGAAGARDRAAAAEQLVSSGVRVAAPSDDLAAWTDGMRSSARAVASHARGTAIGGAQDDLQMTDGALDTIAQSLHAAITIASELGNGTLGNPALRASAANQVQSLIDQAVAAGNSRGSDGSYLLAGSKNNAAPFDPLGNYLGDNLTRSVEVAEGRQAIANETGSGLTLGGGVDVFATLRALKAALLANNPNATLITLGDLQTSVAQVGRMRTEVGFRLQAMNLADGARVGFETRLASVMAHALEVDPVEAISQLTSAKNALDAASAVASQIVELTRPK